MVVLGECVWDMTRYGDMINERAVRILLECILVVLVSPPTLNTRVKEVVRVFFCIPTAWDGKKFNQTCITTLIKGK